MTHVIMIICAHHISFLHIDSQLIIDFPSNFALFTVKSPGITQRSFLKKMLLKKAKTRRLFYSKL